jgi:hypothetical protein
MRDFKFFKKNKKEFPIDDIFIPIRSQDPPLSFTGSTYIRPAGIIENEVNRVVTDSHCESVFNFIRTVWFTDVDIMNKVFNTFGNEDENFSFAIINQFDLVDPHLKNIIVFCYINNDLFKLRIETTRDLVDYHKITVWLPTQNDVHEWNSLNS